MAKTYEQIASTTLGSTAATVTLSSIPSTYADVILVCSFEFDTAAQFRIRVGNGSVDTGTNYSFTGLVGNGTTASSFRRSSQAQFYAYNGNGITANTRTIVVANFMSYANTNVYKTALLAEASPSDEGVAREVMLWRSTSAINVIEIYSASGELFEAGSKFKLYGLVG